MPLSTGPEARYTHWKQTVFYMPDSLTIQGNEVISGSFEVEQNKRNKVRAFKCVRQLLKSCTFFSILTVQYFTKIKVFWYGVKLTVTPPTPFDQTPTISSNKHGRERVLDLYQSLL